MDYLPQNPAILVSSINMLLRDEEFDSLESLCYNFLSRSARTIISYLALFERLLQYRAGEDQSHSPRSRLCL